MKTNDPCIVILKVSACPLILSLRTSLDTILLLYLNRVYLPTITRSYTNKNKKNTTQNLLPVTTPKDIDTPMLPET